MKFEVDIDWTANETDGFHFRPIIERIPRLKPNSRLRLVFEEDQLLNEEERQYWRAESTRVVPSINGIAIGFNKFEFDSVQMAKMCEEEHKVVGLFTSDFDHFVRVWPSEPLALLCCRGRKASLLPCKITLPFGIGEATSLNQAYQMISQVLQPSRINHGASVFQCAYYYCDEEAKWKLINKLR